MNKVIYYSFKNNKTRACKLWRGVVVEATKEDIKFLMEYRSLSIEMQLVVRRIIRKIVQDEMAGNSKITLRLVVSNTEENKAQSHAP